MSDTNEMQDNLDDLVANLGANTTEEVRDGSRSIRRAHSSMGVILDAAIKLRGLNSPKRGFSVARIERAG